MHKVQSIHFAIWAARASLIVKLTASTFRRVRADPAGAGAFGLP
jgi:hypothetical protein